MPLKKLSFIRVSQDRAWTTVSFTIHGCTSVEKCVGERRALSVAIPLGFGGFEGFVVVPTARGAYVTFPTKAADWGLIGQKVEVCRRGYVEACAALQESGSPKIIVAPAPPATSAAASPLA